ncbi:Uncharacterized protein TCM_042069 [Theobroma cacao]|uniref:Uncharacterized protein n=1 Tax=Theobroma cacao TaxID=3641 RepID=A0A061GY36_THECC|nr:Uncharacterized protein TCM_042069 [Theobroma cacao]
MFYKIRHRKSHPPVGHQSESHNQQHYQVVPSIYWQGKPSTDWACLLAWTKQLFHSATSCGARVHVVCPCFYCIYSTKYSASLIFEKYNICLLSQSLEPFSY